jgi:hypothetical protein
MASWFSLKLKFCGIAAGCTCPVLRDHAIFDFCTPVSSDKKDGHHLEVASIRALNNVRDTGAGKSEVAPATIV